MNEFYNPVHIEFGQGSISFLNRFLKGRKALLVTSQGFVKRGLVSQIQEVNPEIIQIINDVQPNPTINQALAFRSMLDYEKFDVIVALGGGSVIDMAKALAPIDSNDTFDFLDALKNGLQDSVEVKPIIAIPTTAGTGSEVTMWGTIWDDVNKKKYSIANEKLYCEAAILDAQLHISIPKEITIQTGLDTLSHSLETFWNKNKNDISTKYAEQAIKKVIEILPLLLDDLSNVTLREQMLLASYQAGIAFSNTQTSIAHAMSYYMTLEKNIPHGIAASITLPYIAEVYGKEQPLPNNLIQQMLALFNQCGVSIQFEDYNLTLEDFDNIFAQLKSNVRAQNAIVDLNELYKVIKNQFKG